MIKTTIINGSEIRYEFKRLHRRSVTAKIRRDGVIEVKAPLLYRESDVLAFLNQHRRWIFNHFDRLQNTDNQQKKIYFRRDSLLSWRAIQTPGFQKQ